MVLNKKKQVKKQIGGQDVVSASVDLVKSMVDLGKSVFNEITSITHIQSDINNVSAQTAVPGVNGPPGFNAPSLDQNQQQSSQSHSAPSHRPPAIKLPPPPRIKLPPIRHHR